MLLLYGNQRYQMLEQGRTFIDAVLTDEPAEALPFAQVRFRSRDLLKDSDSEHDAASGIPKLLRS